MLQNKRVYAIFFIMVILAFLVGIAILGAAPRKRGSSSSTATNSKPVITTNCNHSLDYWATHTERYPPYMVIGDQKYFREQVATILANPDPAQALLKQVLVAFLNTSTEGRQGGNPEELLEAYQWLAAHPAGGALAEYDRLDSERLVAALEKFNDGLAGLPPCDDPITPTPTATVSSTRMPTMIRPFTSTPTLTATLTPSPTSTRTSKSTGTPTLSATATRTITRTRKFVPRTPTSEPGHEPPTVGPTNPVVISPSWTPEIIVTTPPSDTPKPPINSPVPSSTNTPAPMATTPPEPTSTYTVPPTVPPPANLARISTPTITAPAPGWFVPTSVVAARQVKLDAIFSVYIRMLENSGLLPKGR
jgi:hypothetical protein